MFEKNAWHDDLPDEKLDVYKPHLRLFFETMYERQMIWKRRFIDKKERPWTDNPIFQTSKFTNVYRELDRNSQWLIKNIILDDKLSLKNLIWKMMVFRFFNCPETFEFDAEKYHEKNPTLFPEGKLISAKKWRNGIPDWEEYDEDEFAEFIAGVRSTGQNPYTTAYLINSQATPGKSRDYCYTRVVIPFLHENIVKLISTIVKAKSPEEIIKFIKTFPSVADFIAHEFYQDFTYIPRYTNRKFMKFDQNDFTNVGPGASIGIRLIYPSLKTIREQKQAIYWLRDMADEMLDKIGKEKGEPFPYLAWDKARGEYYLFTKQEWEEGELNDDPIYHGITLHQIEMWLCEFQKYWKMIIGEGKQRSKFVPKSKSIISK